MQTDRFFTAAFYLIVLESVYIKTQNPVLLRQKSSIFTWNRQVNNGNGANGPPLGQVRRILSCVSASGYIFRFNFRLLSGVSYSDQCRTKKCFSVYQKKLPTFSCCKKIANHCNCMTGIGGRGVNKGNFGGVATLTSRQRRRLSNQSSDKVNFSRIPRSTSTNGHCKFAGKLNISYKFADKPNFGGAPQPPMATSLVGETCSYLASIMFFID